jgi:hypothetical protein
MNGHLVVNREAVESCAFLAMAIADDPSEGEQIRADTADLLKELCDLLLYQQPGLAGREIRLKPVGMTWPRFYPDMTEEFLVDVGAEVVADNPLLVLLARRAAELCDNVAYSVDFRLHSLDVLNEILAALKRAAEEEDGVPDELVES